MNSPHRFKRKLRGDDDDKWDCTVCTYINPRESYKCEICHTRKGTSTRKPRINTQVVEQQQLIAQTILKEKDDEHKRKKEVKGNKSIISSSKRFDQNSPLMFKIFANGYSVVITEFPTKPSKMKTSTLSESPVPSNCSSHQGFISNPGTIPDDLSSIDSVSNAHIQQTHPLSTYCEYEFSDSSDLKANKHVAYSVKTDTLPTFNLSRSSGEQIHPFLSYSSASSSIGGNTLSRTSSPPNSLGPCLAEVKREQAALEAEQAARDGDDEREEEDENANLLHTDLPCATHSTDTGDTTVGTITNDIIGTSSVSCQKTDTSENSRFYQVRNPSCSVLKRKQSTSVTTRSNCVNVYNFQHTNHSRRKLQSQVTATALICNRSLRSSSVDQTSSIVRKRSPKHVRRKTSNSRSSKRQRLDVPSGDDNKTVENSDSGDNSGASYLKCDPVGIDIMLNTVNEQNLLQNKLPISPEAKQLPIVLSTPQSHSRLSTESKNTSAMTDSGGATALEIST